MKRQPSKHILRTLAITFALSSSVPMMPGHVPLGELVKDTGKCIAREIRLFPTGIAVCLLATMGMFGVATIKDSWDRYARKTQQNKIARDNEIDALSNHADREQRLKELMDNEVEQHAVLTAEKTHRVNGGVSMIAWSALYGLGILAIKSWDRWKDIMIKTPIL